MKSNIYPMYTKDIYLRALDRKDIEQNTLWINSEYVSDIMGYLPVMPITQQFEWWEKLKTDIKRYIFAICLKDGDKYIGNIGLGNINYVSRHAMISIFIADRSNHGKGMGSDAMRLIMVFAFERLNLNKVYLQTSSRFVAAIKMYENLGFKKEGIMRQHYYSNGEYEDKILYSILRDEFA